MTRIEPCGWEVDFTGCRSGPCCPDIDAPENAAVKTLATKLATNILWRLTGMRFSCCEITVRPCKPKTCDPQNLTDVVYWDQRYTGMGNLGVMSSIPTLINGATYNVACGCPQGCCKCRSDCEVYLPGPVCEVIEVIRDGVVVDPSNYVVYQNPDIIAFNADNCPPCQNYNLPAGEEGTWTVRYTIGVPVPAELEYAAGLFACEIAKAMIGDTSCGLPDRVQSISRRGVNFETFDPLVFAKEGLTGIPLVDSVILSLNPYQLKQDAIVWSPDLPKIRREA